MKVSMMIIWFLTNISWALIAYKCKCTQINHWDDCNSQKGECGLFTPQQSDLMCGYNEFIPNCPFHHTVDKCDNQDGCAWTDDEQCLNFTQCSDYSIKVEKNSELCYLKDSTCVPNYDTTNGSINCITDIINCQIIANPSICNQVITGQTSSCYWAGGCTEQDFSKCSTITQTEFCISKECVYQNSRCTAPKCVDQNYTKCTSIRDDALEKVQICVWKQNQCQNAEDVSHLDYGNCFSSTGGSYQYNFETNVCEPCAHEDADSTQLIVALSVSIPIGLVLITGAIVYVKKKRLYNCKGKLSINQTNITLQGHYDG